jgi:hypothetical protein
MKAFRSDGLTGVPARLAQRAARRSWCLGRRAAALVAALAGMSLVTVFAAVASAAPPPPAPRVTPGATVAGAARDLVYTAADGSVWLEDVASGPSTPTGVGGHLVSGPSTVYDGNAIVIFGQGTDNQLWVVSCPSVTVCGPWRPLGGVITSKPGAVGKSRMIYSVYARGTDGAVWGRDYNFGWGGWYKVGGQVLAGTGPAAAYLGGTYVMVAGTDKQLYIEQQGVTGFGPAGGATTASPALTMVFGTAGAPNSLVGFARGTNGTGYYHRFLASSPGWHSMGGALTSGVAAVSDVKAAIPDTYTFGLGTNNQVYENSGTWAPNPSFNGWVRVTG